MSELTVTETCKFPGCANAPEPASAKPGRPPEYCVDPAHNPVSAWRERKRLADAERGVTTTEAEVEQPVTMARVTGAEMLRQMRDLAGQLAGVADRLAGAAATLGDPGAAEAEVEAARRAAEQRAAAAESARADAELRAERADQSRAVADEAAEQMSEHLAAEQVRAREAHERLAEATAAQVAELDQIREGAQTRIAVGRGRPGQRDCAGGDGQGRGHRRGRAAREPRAGAGTGGDRTGAGRGRDSRPGC